MKALIRNGRLVEDPYVRVAEGECVPATGAVLVTLAHWRANRDELIRRAEPLGLWLRSDQQPGEIAADLAHFALIALEFPVFKDGRAYSVARLLRERWHFAGELRAVGDVLLEQLHFMQRVGFDAFELASDDPLRDWETATGEFSTWYQATGDGRLPARMLRHARPAASRIA
jgi:uncharacterized protein (DUF934 family)